ncbi:MULTISPECIES: ABC transporter permease [Brucella/Ochrobactrum group]|jgi:ribose transport system permease protein|uniref:ABC transporter permease n=1 Tax=Brucella/Ochrobactrum group TaxID=2826938 RepID=UPI001C03EDE7|nr:ABC transporter permease [Brucella sp. NBRC 12950]QWK80591.1 ABC transporter permease [Ochrobactrum sp. BTU1]GLU27892.1 monosaccharide-transporting ATPase [Brucella sp. NBRC 12950]
MSTNPKAASLVSILINYNIYIMLVALIVVSSVLSEHFLTLQNIFNLLRQLAPLSLVAIGMLLVILTGGIDLSVGSVAAIGGMGVAMFMPALPFDGGIALVLCVIGATLFGGLLGAINGVLVAGFGMASFVATLAMMTMARGLAYMLSNGQPVRFPRELPTAQILTEFGSKGMPGIGLPWPVLAVLLVIALFIFLLRRTNWGRLTIATGSNENAVRLAGLPVWRYKFLAFTLCGALSALAGIFVTARTAVGTPVTGIGLELDAIAACVIGGALLSGGKGTIVNTMIGVLILGLIGNIMNLMSVPAYPQQIIKGVIIILAVLMQGISANARRRV